MGLDALSAEVGRTACLIRITTMSDIDVIDIDPLTGLFGLGADPVDRPFGRWIRVQGIVPGPTCPEYATHEFQVRVSVDGGPETPILHPAGLDWRRNVSPCITSNALYTSDPSGWFALTDYWRFNECPDDASLAFWNSLTAPGADVAVFRLVLRPIGGGAEILSAPVTVRIDNEAPTDMIAELYNVGAAEPFGDQCEIDFDGADIIMDIKGRVRDEHFASYELLLDRRRRAHVPAGPGDGDAHLRVAARAVGHRHRAARGDQRRARHPEPDGGVRAGNGRLAGDRVRLHRALARS